MAERGVVVLAVVDHEAVVLGCESGVEAAGLIGAHKECFSHYMLATFGGPRGCRRYLMSPTRGPGR
jgi:hypothetical protein